MKRVGGKVFKVIRNFVREPNFLFFVIYFKFGTIRKGIQTILNRVNIFSSSFSENKNVAGKEKMGNIKVMAIISKDKGDPFLFLTSLEIVRDKNSMASMKI